MYKNRDICLVVYVDLFAQTERASNIFKKYPALKVMGVLWFLSTISSDELVVLYYGFFFES